MKNRIFILLLVIAGCTTINAQDVDSVNNWRDVVVEHRALLNEVHEISWRNPAMMESAYRHSLTHFISPAIGKKRVRLLSFKRVLDILWLQ